MAIETKGEGRDARIDKAFMLELSGGKDEEMEI